jgi:integrase
LIEQKENIKYIQTQLGHSTASMTLDVYGHLMTPCNQNAPAKLENTVFAATGSNWVAENRKGVTA